MKIGEAVVVFNDVRGGQSPESAEEQGAEKHQFGCPEILIEEVCSLEPNDVERERGQREEDRIEFTQSDEMLERKKRQANEDDTGCSSYGRERDVTQR